MFLVKLIKDFFIKLRRSAFARDAFILTLGTVIAQILPFLFYPLLGRIFNPAEFGLLATITAIIPFVTILASGMYENAILLAESKQEAANVVGMIMFRSLVVTLLFGLLLYPLSPLLSKLLNEPELSKWLFVVPISAFAMVIYSCFNEWCVTNKYFVSLSWNKITYTSAITLGKVGFGTVRIFGNGLILGDLLGKLLTATMCIYRAFCFDKTVFQQIKFSQFKLVARKYVKISRYLIPDQVLNNIGGSIHIFFIGTYYSITELGYISLAVSLLTVPVTVISSSIKDVFRQKANEEYVVSGNCRNTYLRLLKPIAFFSLIFFIPLYFILPTLFPFFLGSKWAISGLYAQLLLPMFVTNFISMSLGGVLIITKKIQVSLIWQIYTIVVSLFAFIIGIFWFKNIEATLLCFMVARSSAYLLYMVLSYYYAKRSVI